MCRHKQYYMRLSSPRIPPMSPIAEKKHLLLYLKLVLVSLFWGGTFIAGRVLAQGMPLRLAATGRFTVAVVLLVWLARHQRGGLPRLRPREVLSTALLGLSGIFLYNLCFFGALAHMAAGRTALFVALNPAMTALGAVLLLRERLRVTQWLGIAVALCGTLIVISRGDLVAFWHNAAQSFGVGEMLMLGSVVSWTAYTLIGKVALNTLTPVAATTYGCAWGLLFLVLSAIPEFVGMHWAAIGWREWLCITYLGAFGTVIGFVWYSEGVKVLGSARTVVFNNLVPAFGVVLAAIVLGEPILLSMVIGGLVTALGVSLTNRRG
jgi:drug/metabolite transporter (DMT)-like permease